VIVLWLKKQLMPPVANSFANSNFDAMKRFAELYARYSETYFCIEPGVTIIVLEGLAKHKEELGEPLCPCRHYEDKISEASTGYWVCPCIPMQERRQCEPMLFLKAEDIFASDRQTL
jgi:ferredoxin-thioredoxin reductase catalytic chain